MSIALQNKESICCAGLGINFSGRLSWSNHINVIIDRVNGMLRNFCPVIDSTPFAIRMHLAKTYLIPVLLYGCQVFANCNTDDRVKLNLAYNNIGRYVFIKGRRDHISQFFYQIFGIDFDTHTYITHT